MANRMLLCDTLARCGQGDLRSKACGSSGDRATTGGQEAEPQLMTYHNIKFATPLARFGQLNTMQS